MECITKGRAEPLRQGDVFQWLPGEREDPWHEFGIIVTADCDIVQNKHGPFLSYCPILKAVSFADIFWLSDQLHRATQTYREALASELGKVAAKNGHHGSISPEVLDGWLARRGPAGVLADVGYSVSDSKALSKKRRLELLAEALAGSGGPTARLELLGKLAVKDSTVAADVENEKAKIWDKLKNRLVNPPGDLFFLNHLRPDQSDEAGYIVYVRRVGELTASEIATRPGWELMEGVNAIRISQLNSPFRYRLTQQLAGVFADIGLPQEYEDLRKKTVADLALPVHV